MTISEYRSWRKNNPIQHFNINLTNDCNLKCYYCFVEQKKEYISLDVMKKIIDFAFDQYIQSEQLNKPLNFTFFGGEPLLCYDSIIVPTINYVKEKSKKYKLLLEQEPSFSITTNGTLLNKERIKFFFDNNISILLSIDGDEESQNYNRPCKDQSNSFVAIKNNFEELLKYFPDTTFRSTLTPFTCDKIIDNFFFVQDSGFTSYFLTPNEYDVWSEKDKFLITSQITLISDYIYESISNKQTPLYFTPFMWAIKELIMPNITSNRSLDRCGLGTTSVGVSPMGLLSGCQEHSSFVNKNDIFYIGDIYHGIDENRHLNLLNNYIQTDHISSKDTSYSCQTCICYNTCNQNSCPSRNYLLSNNIHLNSEIICFWNKVLFYAAENFLTKAAMENNQNIKQYLNYFLVKK